MKKHICSKVSALLLAFCTMFSLAACGVPDEANGSPNTIPAGSEEVEAAEMPEEAGRSDEEPDASEPTVASSAGTDTDTDADISAESGNIGAAQNVASQLAQNSSEPIPDTPAPTSQPGDPEDLPFMAFPFAFTATDLYGNAVTEKTLGEKRIFFVHYWATWCGPCVNEMSDLAEAAREHGDSVGFIALLDDYGSNLSGAKRIVESADVPSSFIMVDAETEGLAGLLSMVQSGFVPTTVYIDGNGELIVDPLVGAYGEFYGIGLGMLLE